MGRLLFFRLWARVIGVVLIFSLVISPEAVYAQSAFVEMLPAPGMMVATSGAFVPVLVKGLVVHQDQPFNFDFIVDSGNDSAAQAVVKEQTQRMAQYFLAALTVPEEQLWVNLSPYERDRVIESELGKTVLGRDMLAQDYILKQLTASLIYPEKGLGKEFWSRVYAEAQAKFGTTDIPVDTFNKVWIMPEKAEVAEKGNAVYVTAARLKVQLDSDRLAMTQNAAGVAVDEKAAVAKAMMREIILPAIETEVNEGRNFAVIRQIYHAAILAKWYRELILNTLLAEAYVGKNKVDGVTTDEKALKDEIYQRYIAAYRKGAFNFIKEEPTVSGEMLPRKYFSGGISQFGTFPLTKTRDSSMSLGKRLFIGSVFVVAIGCSVVLYKDDQGNVPPVANTNIPGLNEGQNRIARQMYARPGSQVLSADNDQREGRIEYYQALLKGVAPQEKTRLHELILPGIIKEAAYFAWKAGQLDDSVFLDAPVSQRDVALQKSRRETFIARNEYIEILREIGDDAAPYLWKMLNDGLKADAPRKERILGLYIESINGTGEKARTAIPYLLSIIEGPYDLGPGLNALGGIRRSQEWSRTGSKSIMLKGGYIRKDVLAAIDRIDPQATHPFVKAIKSKDYSGYLKYVNAYMTTKDERQRAALAGILKMPVYRNKTLDYVMAKINLDFDREDFLRKDAPLLRLLKDVSRFDFNDLESRIWREKEWPELKVSGGILVGGLLAVLVAAGYLARGKNDDPKDPVDAAMPAERRAGNGGIDLQGMAVVRAGGGRIRLNDQLLQDALEHGFNGFMPVITRITPVTSPWLLLGAEQAGEI